MSRQLALLPFDRESVVHTSFEILWCDLHSGLFSEIEDLSGTPVPKDFKSFLSWNETEEGHTFGLTIETAYDEPLIYVTVEQLTDLATHEGVTFSWKNRAVWAYLSMMPKNMVIALCWD